MYLLVHADVMHSKQYYITPTKKTSCLKDPCLTLAEFATNSTTYQGDVSLFFLPGNHSLDRGLYLSHAHNFSMTKDVQDDGTVLVECTGQEGRFDINATTFVEIKGFHFIGCGGNTVTNVSQFILEDTILQGVEGRGTALILNEVAAAKMVRSSFCLNTSGRFKQHILLMGLNRVLDYFSQEWPGYSKTPLVGGALYAAFSNVSVKDSKFNSNRAKLFGAALAAVVSNISITNCTFMFNKAGEKNLSQFSGFGVILSYQSHIHIVSSIFFGNTALIGGTLLCLASSLHIISSNVSNSTSLRGGAVYTSESSFNIVSSTFTGNSAVGSSVSSGGVIIAFDSFFNNNIIFNCTFTNNSAAQVGGVMYTSHSLFKVSSSTFTGNSVVGSFGAGGGVIGTFDRSGIYITNSTFANNTVTGSGSYDPDAGGGVMCTNESVVTINNSTFVGNSAVTSGNYGNASGGVIYSNRSSYNVIDSIFISNSATGPDASGGVMAIAMNSSFIIVNCKFNNNSAAGTGNKGFGDGGAVFMIFRSMLNITISAFTDNSATGSGNGEAIGGAVYIQQSSFIITRSIFTGNNAAGSGNGEGNGGAVSTQQSSFNITRSIFTGNNAVSNGPASTGGAIDARLWCSFTITNSNFSGNFATGLGVGVGAGGAIYAISNSFSILIINCTFTGNSATGNNGSSGQGGVMFIVESSFNITNSNMSGNYANMYGGIMFTRLSSTHIGNTIFKNNIGSICLYNSNLTFYGNITFENCMESPNKTEDELKVQEGGAITSFQSRILFTGVSKLVNNAARDGGAILATQSTLTMYSQTAIASNCATNSSGSGGGIYLLQSEVEIIGDCNISNNHALKGGGIHAISSTITVHHQGNFNLINNVARNGGGMYLQVNSRLYLLKSDWSVNTSDVLTFIGNHANKGGAVYVADDTNSGSCSSTVECFIQALALYIKKPNVNVKINTLHVLFSKNTADEHWSDIFGGLLDRCIPSPFSEVYLKKKVHYSGVTYVGNISNVTLDSIASKPLRLCFCTSDGQQDCSYQLPTIRVMRGETFTVPLVAVDQVNHSIESNITSSLSSFDGGFGEDQQSQRVHKSCTNLTFNVFSSHDSEKIKLYADGPCASSTPSTRHVNIQFINCSCPIGFDPTNSDPTRCECDCNKDISHYITNCNHTTKSILRVNTNSWITYINDTDTSGYVIYPNCPFDYCHPPSKSINIDLNLPNGADMQCAYNRSGILCGSCKQHLSLSLGSSRCLPCDGHWPVVLAVVLLANIIAGILLVIILLVLNITVAVGLINGIIFYANIITANHSTVFPSAEASFPSILVAWLNLNIGFDACFFRGLDAYIKTWLGLAFPSYIIFLVIVVIKVSEHSPRFTRLLGPGKRDPVATLATLTLLSYAKLLSVTINALSFAELHYPDGSKHLVWLPDGSVRYFRDKHIILALVALLIILISVPYTFLLFFWQWLIRTPKGILFSWIQNTKLNAIVTTYHAPYNYKHRYWTGLLLLVRVVLYTTAAVTESGNPQVPLLMTNILTGCLLFLKGIFGVRIYRKLFVDIVETMILLNLFFVAAFSLYEFKTDSTKETAIAYVSTIIISIMLLGVIAYHLTLLMNRKSPSESTRPLIDVISEPVAAPQLGEVTHSVIDIPKPQDQEPDTESEVVADSRKNHNDSDQNDH